MAIKEATANGPISRPTPPYGPSGGEDGGEPTADRTIKSVKTNVDIPNKNAHFVGEASGVFNEWTGPATTRNALRVGRYIRGLDGDICKNPNIVNVVRIISA